MSNPFEPTEPMPGTDPTVVVGPSWVPFDKTAEPLPDEQRPTPRTYDLYRIALVYDSRTGESLNRSTVKGQLHPVARLHRPTLKLTFDWTAERVGQTPDIPDPCPPSVTMIPDPALNNALVHNYILSRMKIRTEQVTHDVPGGEARHVITGKYTFWVRGGPCSVPLVEAVPPFLVPEYTGKPEGMQVAQLILGGVQGAVFQQLSGKTVYDLATQTAELLGLTANSDLPAQPDETKLPGRQPVFRRNANLIWWRLATVPAANGYAMCPGCDSGTTGVPPPPPGGSTGGMAGRVRP